MQILSQCAVLSNILCTWCLQGDWQDVMPDFILKTFGKAKSITKKDIYYVDNKRKVPFYDEEDE